MKSFKQAYDNIFSLGHDCSVAYQLRENGLITASGPFDWFAIDDLSVITDNIEDRFSRFFLPENMSMDTHQDEKSGYYIYTDTATGIKSFHDIPKSCNNIAGSLIGLNRKFHRRVDRFFELIQKGNKTLLIRKIVGGDLTDLTDLSEVLSDMLPSKCTILGVSHIKIKCVMTTITKMSYDVYVANMDCDSDNSLKRADVPGNFKSWNRLFQTFCELANPAPPYALLKGGN